MDNAHRECTHKHGRRMRFTKHGQYREHLRAAAGAPRWCVPSPANSNWEIVGHDGEDRKEEPHNALPTAPARGQRLDSNKLKEEWVLGRGSMSVDETTLSNPKNDLHFTFLRASFSSSVVYTRKLRFHHRPPHPRADSQAEHEQTAAHYHCGAKSAGGSDAMRGSGDEVRGEEGGEGGWRQQAHATTGAGVVCAVGKKRYPRRQVFLTIGLKASSRLCIPTLLPPSSRASRRPAIVPSAALCILIPHLRSPPKDIPNNRKRLEENGVMGFPH
ncbi:hypothetical protein K438DRAFT_2023783 [Mycena galopus ATCC 62051]|nr:hypothetical protein K438DRAFT_2023783 [Mycena galopus ATCC 62051]